MLRIAYIAVPLMIFMSYGQLHQGHRIALMFFLPVILGEMSREKPIRYFCYYCALYGMVIQLLYMLGIKTRIDSQNAVIATHFIIIGMVVYVSVIKSSISNEKYYNIICISAMVQVLLGILQSHGVDPYLYTLKLLFTAHRKMAPTEVVGTLGNPNFIAAYLAISLPFFFRKPWAWFTPIIIWQLWISNTSGAVYAALAGMAFYFTLRQLPVNDLSWRFKGATRICRYGPSILAIIIGVIFTVHGDKTGTVTSLSSSNISKFNQLVIVDDMGTGGRTQRFVVTTKKIFQHWYTVLIGYGPGAKTPYKCPIHNEWLEYWYQFGLPFIIAACAFIFGMRKQNKILFAALIIVAVNCLANYPLHLAPSAMLILIIMGLLEREKWQTT